jgi:TPR repeat protein
VCVALISGCSDFSNPIRPDLSRQKIVEDSTALRWKMDKETAVSIEANAISGDAEAAFLLGMFASHYPDLAMEFGISGIATTDNTYWLRVAASRGHKEAMERLQYSQYP